MDGSTFEVLRISLEDAEAREAEVTPEQFQEDLQVLHRHAGLVFELLEQFDSQKGEPITPVLLDYTMTLDNKGVRTTSTTPDGVLVKIDGHIRGYVTVVQQTTERFAPNDEPGEPFADLIDSDTSYQVIATSTEGDTTSIFNVAVKLAKEDTDSKEAEPVQEDTDSYQATLFIESDIPWGEAIDLVSSDDGQTRQEVKDPTHYRHYLKTCHAILSAITEDIGPIKIDDRGE